MNKQDTAQDATRHQLLDLIKLYMYQDDRQAVIWVNLLQSMTGFSTHYYRTHLMLGERSMYRTTARENGHTQRPIPMDWYLTTGRDTDRLEDVLDQCVHLADGSVTQTVVGIDTAFKRILTKDGQVYELHNRLRMDKPVERKTAALLMAAP